jgi:hypothetical protein
VRGIATTVLLAAFLLTARAAGTLELFFIDIGEPLGTDRMAGRGFRNYEPIRSAAWRPPS